jgi:hypothetical protein
MKYLLELDFLSARRELMKSFSYCNISLPPYYDFSNVLQNAGTIINELHLYNTSTYTRDEASAWNKCMQPSLWKRALERARNLIDINYEIIWNKDWNLKWRKLQLIHPLLYTSLVNVITDPINRDLIQKHLLFNNARIECCSLPVIQRSNTSEEQINNWRSKIEKWSIEQALYYEYTYHTDIANCYWSIYTHSISWALHSKMCSKQLKNRRSKKFLWNIIDDHLTAMSYWQTNWIPQGNSVSDLIAEIVLKAIDNEVEMLIQHHEKENEIKLDYKILRYRDDYRIFSKSSKDWEIVLKIISEVLMNYGMALNSQKTFSSSDIISSSVKDDKWHYMLEIWNRTKDSFRQKLLKVYDLWKRYPNAWSVKKALSSIKKDMNKYKFRKERSNHTLIISTLISIWINSPASFHLCIWIISVLLEKYSDTDREKIINDISKKVSILPNNCFLEIRLQRLTAKSSIKYVWTNYKILNWVYEETQLFDYEVIIWDWDPKVFETIPKYSFSYIDQNKLQSAWKIIWNEEILLFLEYSL